jgi:hypothetical protein
VSIETSPAVPTPHDSSQNPPPYRDFFKSGSCCSHISRGLMLLTVRTIALGGCRSRIGDSRDDERSLPESSLSVIGTFRCGSAHAGGKEHLRHKLSRRGAISLRSHVSPVKTSRDSINYGTRMNRRLHHLPFRDLQYCTSYKASFEGIPTVWIDPAYTSQRCPIWGTPSEPQQEAVQMS